MHEIIIFRSMETFSLMVPRTFREDRFHKQTFGPWVNLSKARNSNSRDGRMKAGVRKDGNVWPRLRLESPVSNLRGYGARDPPFRSFAHPEAEIAR